MIPRRLSPSASPLPASSASGTPPAAGELPPQNTVPDSTPLQTLPRPAGHSPQRAKAPSSVAAPARKRSLPLPATPRTDPGPLQAAPAVPPRSHAALQRQAQAFSVIAKAFGHFGGMRWLTLDDAHRQALIAVATDLPSAPPSSVVTATERRQQHLHEMLSSIQQTVQDMDWLASQPPLSPHEIEPAMLTAFVPAVHYGQVTIDGPHRDETGQPHFYLERQDGHACAQHAINAMVGGPLVSLAHFAQWEACVQGQQDLTPAALAQMAANMQAYGVHLETVQGTLQALGIPTHLYAHRPITHLQGLDPVQARFLDGLPTDRLLLQADQYEGDSKTSHYVAFRRDAGQWVLLDSLHGAAQYGVAPSVYLLGDEKIRHFTALWPQHALKAGARAEAPRKRVVRLHPDTQQKFLAGLAPFAAGNSMEECNHKSGLAGFRYYFTSEGELTKSGQVLYDKLPPEQQAMVDQATAARKIARVTTVMSTESTIEKFIMGLEPYAAGRTLLECEHESGLAGFSNYLTDAGGLQKVGKALYDRLPPEQQDKVDQAIAARKIAREATAMSTESTIEKLIRGLEPYAAGNSLEECKHESDLAGFKNYLTTAGGLKEAGKALYDRMPPEQQAKVDKARLSRAVWFAREKIYSKRFLDAIHRFSTSSLQIEAIEQASGLKKGHLGLLLSDTGLTEVGRRYVEEKFNPQEQEEIQRQIRLRVLPP